MNETDHAILKQDVVDALWRATDRTTAIVSATLSGSFASGNGLDGFSDIDTILVVNNLTPELFIEIQHVFSGELTPVLAKRGWRLRLNTTLGPLKFNDAETAVLHLMIYDSVGHRSHVIKSPFTCFDWQRSALYRKAPMANVYPVFALQPRHFFGARRSAQDYLGDLRDGKISFREIQFEGGYQEVKRAKAMDERDRHEFAYHILRFLMQNAVKLVRRTNGSCEGEVLLEAYGSIFPDGMDVFGPMYRDLARLKKSGLFHQPLQGLMDKTAFFAASFERQFRDEFEHFATRQVWLRHAPTAWNVNQGNQAILQGRSDQPIIPLTADATRTACSRIQTLGLRTLISSPLSRAHATAQALAAECGIISPITVESSLLEIDYGLCEGLTAAHAQATYPELARGWADGEDPRFPQGECSADVAQRVAAVLDTNRSEAVLVTHNVVLRELVGSLMGVSPSLRHRIKIPHLAPIEVIHSRRFGAYVELSEDIESACFSSFFNASPACL